MAQPQLTPNIFFGNAALPDGQGTMAWISLNDGTKWKLRDYEVDGTNRELKIARKPYQQRGVFVADDFGAKKLVVPIRYLEAAAGDFGAAKAQLSQAGEQWISTDNKVTAALCKLSSFGTPAIKRSAIALLFELSLEFMLGTNPFFEDVAATTPAGFPIAQGGAVAPGTTQTTAIVYAGSVKTRPVYTLIVTVSNTVVLTFWTIKNAMTGETLVVNFGAGLAATTAYTITVDAEAGTVTDQNGTFYDHQGSFPSLVGPVGTSQNLLTTLITASGTSTGVTVGCSYKNRWEL